MTDDTAMDLTYAEIRDEMSSDPLSKALLERAELAVLARKQAAQVELYRNRISELEAQHPEKK